MSEPRGDRAAARPGSRRLTEGSPRAAAPWLPLWGSCRQRRLIGSRARRRTMHERLQQNRNCLHRRAKPAVLAAQGHNPSVTATPCQLPLHKGAFRLRTIQGLPCVREAVSRRLREELFSRLWREISIRAVRYTDYIIHYSLFTIHYSLNRHRLHRRTEGSPPYERFSILPRRQKHKPQNFNPEVFYYEAI